jgi:hypothetical protein
VFRLLPKSPDNEEAFHRGMRVFLAETLEAATPRPGKGRRFLVLCLLPILP